MVFGRIAVEAWGRWIALSPARGGVPIVLGQRDPPARNLLSRPRQKFGMIKGMQVAHVVSGSTAASAVVLGASPRTDSEHQCCRAGAVAAATATREAHVVPENREIIGKPPARRGANAMMRSDGSQLLSRPRHKFGVVAGEGVVDEVSGSTAASAVVLGASPRAVSEAMVAARGRAALRARRTWSPRPTHAPLRPAPRSDLFFS